MKNYLRFFIRKRLIFSIIGVGIFGIGCLPFQLNPLDKDTEFFQNIRLLELQFLLNYKSAAQPRIQFSPEPGRVTSLSSIHMQTNFPSYPIHYTLDGTTPQLDSLLYTEPLQNVYIYSGVPIHAALSQDGAMIQDSFTSGIYSYPLMKTRQTASYSSRDDGELQEGMAESYSDNGDGTITDNTTGLVWMQCNVGQTLPGCMGSADEFVFADANEACSTISLAGRTWRLPTIQELSTLVRYQTFPRIHTTYFPNSELYYTWSSTAVSNSLYTMVQDFNTPTFAEWSTIGDSAYVRCVSGSTRFVNYHYQELGNDEIVDLVNGLVWKKCSHGQIGENCSGSASMVNYTTALSSCQAPWRLPNINELRSLLYLVYSSSNPYIHSNFFPNTPSAKYWSSTTYSVNTSSAYTVDFLDTSSFDENKSHTFHLRCVRNL